MDLFLTDKPKKKIHYFFSILLDYCVYFYYILFYLFEKWTPAGWGMADVGDWGIGRLPELPPPPPVSALVYHVLHDD